MANPKPEVRCRDSKTATVAIRSMVAVAPVVGRCRVTRCRVAMVNYSMLPNRPKGYVAMSIIAVSVRSNKAVASSITMMTAIGVIAVPRVC